MEIIKISKLGVLVNRIRFFAACLQRHSSYLGVTREKLQKEDVAEQARPVHNSHIRDNHAHIFPQLPEQSWFNRKCRRLNRVAKQIQQQLVMSHLQDNLRIIDSTPIPVVSEQALPVRDTLPC